MYIEVNIRTAAVTTAYIGFLRKNEPVYGRCRCVYIYTLQILLTFGEKSVAVRGSVWKFVYGKTDFEVDAWVYHD